MRNGVLRRKRYRSQKSRKITRIILISGGAVILAAAFLIVFVKVLLPPLRYQKAVRLYTEGSYEEASSLFARLGDYKDSADYAGRCEEILRMAAIRNAKTGDTIVFGSYEQDNDTENGTEPIEWLVLAREGDRILVISAYALDAQIYNSDYTDIRWETCYIRSWLNGTFLPQAFSEEEISMIPTVTVVPDVDPIHDLPQENATEDQVFLLSVTEVNKYFNSIQARACRGTEYCYAQRAYRAYSGYCWWWVRSPGSYRDAAYVSAVGSVCWAGHSVFHDLRGIRPAMWIDVGF